MTESAVNTGRADIASWVRLFLVYNVVMLAVGVPVAVFAYRTVHELWFYLHEDLFLSWTPASVVAVCLLAGLAANLVFLTAPLADLAFARWRHQAFARSTRLGLFAVWLLVSLLGVAAVWLTFFTLPISLM
jgi:hypothetical protein